MNEYQFKGILNGFTGRPWSGLRSLMNSKLFDWYLKLTTEAEVQGGGIQLYVTTLEKTLLKLDFTENFTKVISRRVNGELSDNEVNYEVFKAYGLTSEEIDHILTCKQVDR